MYTKGRVAEATYFNFLMPSAKWNRLTAAQEAEFEADLPFRRTPGSSPADGNGY